VTESDPEEDPEEYEDDETEDGPVNYPMDGEMMEMMMTAIHLGMTLMPVFPPEGIEPVIPPPSTDITIGARVTVWPQTSISLPPEAEALIDVVTAALPSHPLPPLPPSLYIPPPVDRSRYEVEESSTARPTRGRGIDYGFVSTVDAEERRQGTKDVGYGIRDTWVDPAEPVPETTPMTVGEVNTRVTELAELHEHDTKDLYALLEDAQDNRSRISQRVNMDSQRVDLLMVDRMTLQETATHQELQTHRDHVYAHETHLQAHQTQLQLQGTLIQTQHQAQMVETLRVIRDMRREMSAMQAELLALREQQRRARQPGPDARIPDHQDAYGDADSHIQ
ncbi:hypothetical protein Tco_1189718, partial [Tanacetum coccineum]